MIREFLGLIEAVFILHAKYQRDASDRDHISGVERALGDFDSVYVGTACRTQVKDDKLVMCRSQLGMLA